jgi:hypothetical protein
MLYFHYPKSLRVNGKTIFCNMRFLGKQIILTGAVYLNSPTEYHLIEYFVNHEKKIFQHIERRAYEPSLISIYENESLSELEIVSIKIKYQNEIYEYILTKEVYPKYDIVSMTLFKEDYRLMDLYVDYYSKMGVECFFFYYNGKLDENMFEFMKECDKPIHITEWNYQYWLKPHELLKYCADHHAQPMAIMDSLYLLKNIATYCLYNDFDEYLILNTSLQNLIQTNPNVNYFSLYCYWAKIGEEVISYDEALEKFYSTKLIQKSIHCRNERRKSFVKLSDIKIMRIHFPSDYLKPEVANHTLGFFHICNFKDLDRRHLVDTNVFQNRNLSFTWGVEMISSEFLNQPTIKSIDRYVCSDLDGIEFIKPFVKSEIWSLRNDSITGFIQTGMKYDFYVFKREKQIKIGFEHFWNTFLNVTERGFLIHLLSLVDNGVYESDHKLCDVIYHSYFGNSFGEKDISKKYIFFSGEKYPISTEKYNLSICQYEDKDKVVCYPFFFTFLHAYAPRYDLVMKQNEDRTIRKEFCAFIVSNPNCEVRNTFFKYLCNYKKVHSFGKVMNNVGYLLDYPYNDPRQLQLLSNYKFMICFENVKTDDYYITEKLLIAKAAGCIPIYWGSHKCLELFDKNSFLYLEEDSIDGFAKLIQKIKLVDENIALYMSMRKKPLLTQQTIENFSKDKLMKKINSYLNL